jgi:2,4-dienoyl-CoA reductase-like NADH-dependent reductase (Old Yellow Enzyme family)
MSRLFEPVTLGSLRLRNRIAHAAVTTRYAEAGRVTARLIAYHAARARGGAALLVTEPMNLLPSQGAPHKVRAHDPANFAGLEAWAAAVRAAGSHLVAQLQDPGRGRLLIGTEVEAIAPSAIADDLSGVLPRALSTGEVEDLVQGFAAAARRLRDLGFAGVEVSAGHGHLIHQFLAARSNLRTDRYGGDVAGRARLLTDLCLALRAACGEDFVIGVKLPGEDAMPDGIDLDTAAAITRCVHATGVADYLTWCWGGHSRSLHLHLPVIDGSTVDGSTVGRPARDGCAPYAAKIAALARHAPGVKVAALGLIRTPLEAERLLQQGLADFVQVGRPFIADAEWGRHAQRELAGASGAGAPAADVARRPCITCNHCWGRISRGEPLGCTVNPALTEGREADRTTPAASPSPTAASPVPASFQRRVVVVGAGPAGVAAACAAAEQGARVTLFGAGERPLRRLREASALPGAGALADLADHLEARAARAGVDHRGGVTAVAADVLALRPDEVVLACGADPAPRERWREHLRGRLQSPLDGADAALTIVDETGSATAPMLAVHAAALGHRVVLHTAASGPAVREPLVERQRWAERCAAAGVEIRSGSSSAPQSPSPRAASSSVLVVAEARPVAALASWDAGPAPWPADLPLRRVGDCRRPATLADALAAGEACGVPLRRPSR